MKVVINALAPEGVGGGITHLRNLVPRLADDDNQYIVCVPSGRNLLAEPDAENIRFYSIPYTDRLIFRLFYQQLILPVLLLYWDVDVLYSTTDITSLLAPCSVLLQVQNPNPYFPSSVEQVSLRTRVKYRLQRWVSRLSAKKAYHVFFVSEFAMKASNEYLKLPEDKISYIYHGVDHDHYRDSSQLPKEYAVEQPYLLSLSTLYPHKNHQILIRGFSKLPDEIIATHKLLIAGRIASESYVRRLKSIAQEEGIADSVVFLGEVPDQVVPSLYSEAEVFVLPSKLETFGLTVIEAMASGTAVIGSNTASIPEVVQDAGILFDPMDADSLADSMKQVLTDERFRAELIKAGFDRADEFDWDKTAEKTKQLLEQAT